MEQDGRWRLAPAYDLTHAYQPDGRWTSQHQMTVNGRRDGFTLDDLRAVATVTGIKRGRGESWESGLLRSTRGQCRRTPSPITTGVDASADGRDRAAEVGGDLAQAVAMPDVRDHGQAGRWNEEDLTGLSAPRAGRSLRCTASRDRGRRPAHRRRSWGRRGGGAGSRRALTRGESGGETAHRPTTPDRAPSARRRRSVSCREPGRRNLSPPRR